MRAEGIQSAEATWFVALAGHATSEKEGGLLVSQKSATRNEPEQPNPGGDPQGERDKLLRMCPAVRRARGDFTAWRDRGPSESAVTLVSFVRVGRRVFRFSSRLRHSVQAYSVRLSLGRRIAI